ncbi:MAG: hypothetical protein BAJALOKI3v1_220016 [Promethearchaeota archaeon]|jgi:hypothetical protein|nr:MAG: hypothetical protein BAJALOKI3v1_220016 [Candidatus Lokiarchaeota archaeon]
MIMIFSVLLKKDLIFVNIIINDTSRIDKEKKSNMLISSMKFRPPSFYNKNNPD